MTDYGPAICRRCKYLTDGTDYWSEDYCVANRPKAYSPQYGWYYLSNPPIKVKNENGWCPDFEESISTRILKRLGIIKW